MDVGSGSFSWGARCGANYIFCGRGYVANSIAYAVVSPTRYLRGSATRVISV